VKLKAVIICDDIREEVGGKLTLVGLYAGSMLIDKSATFPAVLRDLAILLRVVAETGDIPPDTFRIQQFYRDEKIFEFTGKLKAANPVDPITVRISLGPFGILGFGEIVFQLDLLSGNGDSVFSHTEKLLIAAAG
jgi:hypothetical protein